MIPALYCYNMKLLLYNMVSFTVMVKVSRHSGTPTGKQFPVEMGSEYIFTVA